MAKQNFLFIICCLVVTIGLMQSYHLFETHFSPYRQQAQQIRDLKKTVQEKELQIAQLENQIFDYQQQVAAVLPALRKIEKKPQTLKLRGLASVSQIPVSELEISDLLAEKARAEFRKGEYGQASLHFSQLIEKYPTSPLVVQAHFFWAESLFLMGKEQECLDVIDGMMNQFPDHELTGFIMLRMGQILQTRSRSEEAGEVYKIVSKNFSFNHELKTQAEQLARSIE